MKLVDAMIMSSRGMTIVSAHSKKRYKPEDLNAKQLGEESAVFDSKAGVSEEEKRGYWSFVTLKVGYKR